MAFGELELDRLGGAIDIKTANKLDDLQMETIVKGENLKPSWKNYFKSLLKLR